MLRHSVALHAIVGVALVLSVNVARAQVPASECCLEMLLPLGARTVALGQALTARAGADAVFINPAALADLEKSQIIFHRSTAADASVSTFEVIIHSRVAGNFGLTYTAMAFPSDEAGQTPGEPTGTLDIFKQTLLGTYATSVALGWTAGVNYRLFHSGITCTGTCGEAAKSGTTHMIDAGLKFTPPWLKELAVGAALVHAGFPLQVNNAKQADVAPTRLRVGAAYNAGRIFTRDSSVAVWLNVDAVQRIRDAAAPALNVGVEVVLDNTIFFRGGHASSGDGTTSGGNGVGFGMKYQRFEINVAKAVNPSSSLLFEDPVYVSFGITF